MSSISALVILSPQVLRACSNILESISNSPKMSSISALVILSPQVLRACSNILESILPSQSYALKEFDHIVIGARPRHLSQQLVQLRFSHENTNVVKSSSQIVLNNCPILVDVHQLEAVLVHLQLLL